MDLRNLRSRAADALYELAGRVDAPMSPTEHPIPDQLSMAYEAAFKGERVPLENTDETLVNAHAADRCAGEHCTIHNRSDHSMRAFPQHWRSDRRIMERICPHGIGHPDPDDPATARDGLHGCDGCCRSEAS